MYYKEIYLIHLDSTRIYCQHYFMSWVHSNGGFSPLTYHRGTKEAIEIARVNQGKDYCLRFQDIFGGYCERGGF